MPKCRLCLSTCQKRRNCARRHAKRTCRDGNFLYCVFFLYCGVIFWHVDAWYPIVFPRVTWLEPAMKGSSSVRRLRLRSFCLVIEHLFGVLQCAVADSSGMAAFWLPCCVAICVARCVFATSRCRSQNAMATSRFIAAGAGCVCSSIVICGY